MLIILIDAVIVLQAVFAVERLLFKQQNDFYKAQGLDVGCYTETGYVKVDDKENKYDNQFFYHLFLKDGVQSLNDIKDVDKFSIWINGGAASQMANFYEFGPIIIVEEDGKIKLLKREITWNKLSYLLFIDYPFNVGLSYSTNKDIVTNSFEAAEYFMQFIKYFLQSRPQFKKTQFYLLGESYAGHYAPVIGKMLIEESILNFKGFALVDGYVSPYDQSRYYSSYLYNIGVIDDFRRNKLDELSTSVANAYFKEDYAKASELMAESYSLELLKALGWMNPSNFQTYIDLNEGAPPFINFINQHLKDYQVPNNVKEYVNSNPYTYSLFTVDQTLSMTDEIDFILSHGVMVLSITGQMDYFDSTPGAIQWVNKLQWPDIYRWKNQKKQLFKQHTTDTDTAGTIKYYNNLCVAIVYKAGHIVAGDNPQSAYVLIKKLFDGNWQA